MPKPIGDPGTSAPHTYFKYGNLPRGSGPQPHRLDDISRSTGGADPISGLGASIDAHAAAQAREAFQLGTIVGANPLTIALDMGTRIPNPVAASTASYVNGDRVLCAFFSDHHDVAVLGRLESYA